MFRQSNLLGAFPHLIAVESTRHGGVSAAPYSSLNLGVNTEDNPAHIQQNRERFFAALGIQEAMVATSHQVHSDAVLIAETSGRREGYDAIVTNKKDLFVAVSVADCTPILVYDARRQVVAAIHAGWKGTMLQIVRKTLETMQEAFGSQPEDCYAYIGTCIDECSYEVGEEVAQHFGEAFKSWNAERQKFMLNLKAANKALLLNWGISEARIEVSPYSTVLNNDTYFSHRHEKGTTGRMMALIGMK